LAEKAARERGIVRQPVSDDEILSRIMVALANEGANVLDEHIAIRPGDIDVIYAYGFGYPRHRGGPMAYADSLGLAHVLAKVKNIARAAGRSLAFYARAAAGAHSPGAGSGGQGAAPASTTRPQFRGADGKFPYAATAAAHGRP
jgi:3-hydroxyacyl-CoA dehydrogenase